MSENKKTRNLTKGKTNDKYNEEGVGKYSKDVVLDGKGDEAEKKEVDEAEIEEIEDKKELEEVLYNFLVPYYFRRVRSDGRVKFCETTCKKCNEAEFANDYWMKLHNAECHSKSDEPIKYECLDEKCNKVFDTRLERHLHTKKHGLKFNINNFVKYGVTGNLNERIHEFFKITPSIILNWGELEYE